MPVAQRPIRSVDPPLARKVYLTNCTSISPRQVDALHQMIDDAIEITRTVFVRHCNRESRRQLEQDLGYALHPSQGLCMASDSLVSYHKSRFRGLPCVYLRYSAIEYIFQDPPEEAE